MNTLLLYFISLVTLVILITSVFILGKKRRQNFNFSTVELATIAFLICMLYAAVIPWSFNLNKIPCLDALIFSISYTAILLIGLQIVPRLGTATLLICGQGLLGQIISRGLNPLWWPYYLACAAIIELLLLLINYDLKKFALGIIIAVARVVISYAYMYLVLAPLVWHKFYPLWYAGLKTSFGIIGSVLGAFIAWKLAPTIKKITKTIV